MSRSSYLAAPHASQEGLRLAYLVSRYPAVSHTFILREVLGLRRLGAQIDVASVNAPDREPGRMTQDEKDEAGQVYYVKRAGITGALGAAAHCLWRHPKGTLRALRKSLGLSRGLRRLYGLGYLAEAMMVTRWMRDRGCRHLHVHFATAAATVGMLARELAPIGLSLTVHGPDEFDDVNGQHLRAKIQAADLVVCISQFARSQLMRISRRADWDKLSVCRLGVAPADAAPRPVAAAPRLLCIGRLTPAKGQHLLLAACAALRAQGYAFTLVLVGAGDDNAALRETAARLGLDDNVRFTGALNQAEVRAELQAADLFVLPSLAEGIPVVLMEAMAQGVPCISSPVNGIPELIRHGEDGLLCAPGDAQALARAIAALLDDPALRERLGQAGKRRVQAEYSLEDNVAALSRLFHEHPAARLARLPLGVPA